MCTNVCFTMTYNGKQFNGDIVVDAVVLNLGNAFHAGFRILTHPPTRPRERRPHARWQRASTSAYQPILGSRHAPRKSSRRLQMSACARRIEGWKKVVPSRIAPSWMPAADSSLQHEPKEACFRTMRLEGGQPVGPIIAKTISNSITSVMQVDIRLALPPSSLVSNFHPSLQESMRVARPASLNLGSRKAITTNLGKRESTSLEAAVIPVGGRVEKLG